MLAPSTLSIGTGILRQTRAKAESSSIRPFPNVKKRKLTVILTHPIQYFAPVYQAISARSHIDLAVIYLTDTGAREYFDRDFGKKLAWDINLLGGYRHRILQPGLERVPKGLWQTYVPGFAKILADEDPDTVLIYGYTRGANWSAWQWARRNKRQILYCSDSVLIRKRASWRLWLKTAVLPWFFKSVDVFLTAGDQNEDYFIHYGVPKSRFLRCPLPVDVTRLRGQSDINRPEARKEFRHSLGIDEKDFVVLQCGKLSNIKRPLDLVKAVVQLRRNGSRAVGLFVGTGTQLENLKSYAASSGCSQNLIFAGFVNQSAIAKFYGAADAIAIPSEEEAHALVAAEGAVFGLPIIVSDQVGCVGPTDVARPFKNALVFPCGDINALAQSIDRVMNDKELWRQMSRSSLQNAEARDISVAAQAIEEAVMVRGGNHG